MYLPWSTARKCGWPKRADNRALRKAYGIGTCSVEEIGSLQDRPREAKKIPPQPVNGKNGN